MANGTSETEPERLLVYKVVAREDGNLDITISISHKAMITYLAGQGGECVMDWESAERRRTSEIEKRGETIREHMGHLVRLGVISETQLLGSSRVLLRLTDMGRNLAASLGVRQ